jgi:multisubunit Na+/H+ antiporter MnhB subunit
MALGGSLIGLIALICAIWVIYDVLTNQKKMSTANKVIWIVAGVIFSIITAIVYYFVVKRN